MSKKHSYCLILALFILLPQILNAYGWESLIIPRLKYDGGGDWYTGPTSMINLLKALNSRLNIRTESENLAVSISDPELFRYPILYMTGHGNIKIKDQDLSVLIKYLDTGGFLWANDSYGLDKYFRREIKKLYPEKELVQLPAEHPIFHNVYQFKDGLPKIHEHDNKPPAAFALYDKGRMKILYTYESDIGDGLEDAGIHKVDRAEVREEAIKMAINIVVFAMMQ